MTYLFFPCYVKEIPLSSSYKKHREILGMEYVEAFNLKGKGRPLQKYSTGLPWNINGPVPMELHGGFFQK